MPTKPKQEHPLGTWPQHVDNERVELADKVNAALEHVRDLECEIEDLDDSK